MSTTTVLNPQRVSEIFGECRHGSTVHVEGIRGPVWFSAERLEVHRPEIEAMLDELPDDFKESSGGGTSFLNACQDKHGNLWTGLHGIMEQLFLLGMGIGKVKLLFPREMWSYLPGGMPYYVITG